MFLETFENIFEIMIFLLFSVIKRDKEKSMKRHAVSRIVTKFYFTLTQL